MNGTTARQNGKTCRAILMIGDTLRKERERQKLSIQDVEQGTSIRAVYIDALEKGEYDKLPGEVYAKGFIKNYGNFLELNGEDLVRQFIMEISPASIAQEDSQAETSNAENKIAAENLSNKYQVSQSDSENSDSRKYLVAAVAAAFILIGGIFYGFSGSDNETETQPAVETQTVETPAVETPPVEPQPQIVQAPPPPVNNVNLQATFSGDCWTRVMVDGKLEYEGMISAGQTFDWKGDESINVLLGNAGAAQFVFNGQNVGSIGGDGDVVERTFTS